MIFYFILLKRKIKSFIEVKKMEKYIAFLRGINVGGKNKIAMFDLKLAFEEISLYDVLTYINSGNVIFSSDNRNKDELIRKVEFSITTKFGLDIPVAILSIKELLDIFMNAPRWWNTGNKEIYDNTIFVIFPTSIDEVFSAVGEAKPEYEKVAQYKNVIFWSFDIKCFSKTRWSKIANSSMNKRVTIRNASTIRKILEICGENIEVDYEN